jgi:archaellum component FlaC
VHLPGTIDTSAVGFHPEYGIDHWTVSDPSLVFERAFDPAETYTTLFAVRDSSDAADDVLAATALSITATPVDADATEPQQAADTTASGPPDQSGQRIEDVVGHSESQAVKDLISGKRETLLEPQSPDEGDGSTEQSAPPSTPATESDSASGGATDGGATTTPPETTCEDGESAATDTSQQTESSTDPDVTTQPSERQRIDHLQHRVSDLEAYTDALEELIDEHGTGESVLDDITTRIEALEDDVGRLSTEIDDLGDDVDTIEQKMEMIFETLTETNHAVDTLADDVSTLEATLSASLETVQSDLDSLHDDLEDLEEFRSLVVTGFGGEDAFIDGTAKIAEGEDTPESDASTAAESGREETDPE